MTVRVVRRCMCGALILFCFLATAAPVAAEWRRIDSPNFIVIGDVSAGQLRDVAVKFEGFREVLGRVISERATATAVPTVVIVFPHDRAFTPFKPLYEGKPVQAAGVFYGGRDVNYIGLVADDRSPSLRVIFHEYAHLMISNFALHLPVWLNEGLAEHYSTYEPSRGGARATIGLPIAHHLRLLAERRLLPLGDLLTVDHDSPLYNERDRQSVFYAQSWALTHMLLLGETDRREKLAAFMRKVAAGTADGDAWREAFGADHVERDLQNYIHRRTFRAAQFDFPDKLTKFEPTVQSVTQPDAQAFLAGLYLRQNRDQDAEKLLAAALQNAPANPLANVVMARREMEKNEGERAAKRLLTIDAASDWFAAYAAGVTLSDVIEGYHEDAPADCIAAARRNFDALGGHGDLAYVLARRVAIDMASPQGPTRDTLKIIERARTLAPGRDDFAYLHARLLAHLQLFPAARAALAPLLSAAAPKHVRAAAQRYVAHIDLLERREKSAFAEPQPSLAGVGSSPTAGGTTQRPSRMIYDFRRLQPGEQRLEGVLERIECPGGESAVFHVRSDETLSVLHAKQMSEVDFIAYRDDLSGTVGCGPVKVPMPVYVTWRAGTTPDQKLVVAVEFLPKTRN